ncbi:uncharacterized protein LOC105277873 isoform X1 [Ooceraea biroi]|uniref:uncharacterized protein LOC105277873 isoform X1 n=1 Tax=Ooceraea biroi TaxID=2015173 RepID=UPI0005B79933|nr:uncharacterized protein LOC105277873 isoform X1 [Ooceraea biroi]
MTGSDCQARWTRLRERYSREKKDREREARSGSGSTIKPTFHLSITNVSSRHINESIEKLDFSNTSQNRSLSYNEDNIINKPISKTVNAVASTSLPSASYSSATEKIESFDSDDDFPLSHCPDVLGNYNTEFSLLEHSPTVLKNRKLVSPLAHSKSSCKRKILSELNEESLDSSSPKLPQLPKRLTKKTKGTSSEDRMEESFLKLTSVVSSHLENKTPNILYDITNEDDIFAKAVACQLKKIMEPVRSRMKGQIMKILYDL